MKSIGELELKVKVHMSELKEETMETLYMLNLSFMLMLMTYTVEMVKTGSSSFASAFSLPAHGIGEPLAIAITCSGPFYEP